MPSEQNPPLWDEERTGDDPNDEDDSIFQNNNNLQYPQGEDEEEFEDEDDGEESEEEESEEEEEEEAVHAPRIRPQTTFASSSSSYYKSLMQWVERIYRFGECVSQAVREYYQLSETDQQQVWQDLVGQDGQRRVFVQGREVLSLALEQEPPSMVQACLEELQEQMQQMPESQKRAYILACRATSAHSPPSLPHDRAFCVRFLRAEKFRVQAAAERMARHFEEKQKLFGDACLGREITYDDLKDDDREALSNGFLQVLPEPDQSNRKVLFYYKALSNIKTTNDCYKERENIVSFYEGEHNRGKGMRHFRSHIKFPIICTAPGILVRGQCVESG